MQSQRSHTRYTQEQFERLLIRGNTHLEAAIKNVDLFELSFADDYYKKAFDFAFTNNLNAPLDAFLLRLDIFRLFAKWNPENTKMFQILAADFLKKTQTTIENKIDKLNKSIKNKYSDLLSGICNFTHMHINKKHKENKKKRLHDDVTQPIQISDDAELIASPAKRTHVDSAQISSPQTQINVSQSSASLFAPAQFTLEQTSNPAELFQQSINQFIAIIGNRLANNHLCEILRTLASTHSHDLNEVMKERKLSDKEQDLSSMTQQLFERAVAIEPANDLTKLQYQQHTFLFDTAIKVNRSENKRNNYAALCQQKGTRHVFDEGIKIYSYLMPEIFNTKTTKALSKMLLNVATSPIVKYICDKHIPQEKHNHVQAIFANAIKLLDTHHSSNVLTFSN